MGERETQTYVIALENEIAATEPRSYDGDKDLLAGQRRTARFRFNNASGLRAFKDGESNWFGIHDMICLSDRREAEDRGIP